MSRQVTQTVTWRLHINRAGGTWRERLGVAMRNLATRVDNRPTLWLDIYTTPTISAWDKAECIRHGVARMADAMRECATAEATEQVMREIFPQLFKEQT